VTDVFASDKRSWIMSRVKSRNTKPERIVRSVLHRMGYRFRLCGDDLPGKPDIVFPGRRKVIFVNGCFWHGHTCRRGKRVPSTNRDYWLAKIQANVRRDRSHRSRLAHAGWRSLTVWECQLADLDRLARRMDEFLADSR